MGLSPAYLAMRAYGRGRRLRARMRPEVPWRGVRILGYHRIADERDDLAVHPRAFREQMLRLVDFGMEPVRLTDVPSLLDERAEGRYVCVTFDDGYLDNLEEGVPALEEAGVPATIFLATEMIEGRHDYSWFAESPPALSWVDVDTLLAGGLVDVQSHTRTHPRLPHIGDEQAWEEIAGSKRDLERRVPYEVTSFCYPAGLHTQRDLDYVEKAGYVLGLSTSPGVNTPAQNRFALNRTLVYWNDTTKDFAAKLTGRLDHTPRLRSQLYRRLARAQRDASRMPEARVDSPQSSPTDGPG